MLSFLRAGGNNNRNVAVQNVFHKLVQDSYVLCAIMSETC